MYQPHVTKTFSRIKLEDLWYNMRPFQNYWLIENEEFLVTRYMPTVQIHHWWLHIQNIEMMISTNNDLYNILIGKFDLMKYNKN